MTQIELIDRLCTVNKLLTDIVIEQAEIMAQHGVEEMHEQKLFQKREEARTENETIEVQLCRFV